MSVVERALNRLRSSQSVLPRVQDRIGSVEVEGRMQRGSAESAPRLLINREAMRAAGYLPESNQDRVFADEYRQIKRPILATAFGPPNEAAGNLRLIMMASALPGDGKTFTSINLAMSLAREKDSTVVLVDADVVKPHISQIFGVERESGLLDALADPAKPIEHFVLSTDVPGLSVLPAGQQGEGATELLASGRMAGIARELLAADPRRLVLFDSSPLLVASESRALAGVTGQVVMIVRSGKTPRQAVLDALAEIGEQKVVSLVLNQGRRGLLGSDYGYGKYGQEVAASR